MKISLVEDDPVVLSLLAELLRAYGHDPRTLLVGAKDTLADVLERLAIEDAEVVLMDVGMPVCGHDVLNAARTDPRFAKVRYLLASASFERDVPSAIPGVRNISKPFELPELLAAIHDRA